MKPAPRPSRFVLFALAGVALLGARALAAEAPPPVARGEHAPRVIVDDRLQRTLGRRVTIDESDVRYFDAEDRPRTLPRSRVLALLPADVARGVPGDQGAIVWRELSDLRREATGRLELVDGQVFPGRLAADGAAGASKDQPSRVRWFHALLNPRGSTLQIPLDEIAVAVLNGEKSGALATMPRSAGDAVGLVNNDRAEGFVASIAEHVALEVGGKTVELALERVAFVRFANAEKPPTGARVWLSDATVVAANDIRSGPDDLVRFVAPARGSAAGPATLADADVLAVNFDATRLRPLAAMPVRVVASPHDRLWARPPITRDPIAAPLGAGEIELPGPMTVEWTLPPGATRVGGTAELPAASRAWGDFTLVLEAVGPAGAARELLRQRLHDGASSIDFNVELAPAEREGAKLRASIDPGESGPIQDRAVFRRVLILVGK